MDRWSQGDFSRDPNMKTDELTGNPSDIKVGTEEEASSSEETMSTKHLTGLPSAKENRTFRTQPIPDQKNRNHDAHDGLEQVGPTKTDTENTTGNHATTTNTMVDPEAPATTPKGNDRRTNGRATYIENTEAITHQEKPKQVTKQPPNPGGHGNNQDGFPNKVGEHHDHIWHATDSDAQHISIITNKAKNGTKRKLVPANEGKEQEEDREALATTKEPELNGPTADAPGDTDEVWTHSGITTTLTLAEKGSRADRDLATANEITVPKSRFNKTAIPYAPPCVHGEWAHWYQVKDQSLHSSAATAPPCAHGGQAHWDQVEDQLLHSSAATTVSVNMETERRQRMMAAAMERRSRGDIGRLGCSNNAQINTTGPVPIWYETSRHFVPIWYEVSRRLVPIWYEASRHLVPYWYEVSRHLVP